MPSFESKFGVEILGKTLKTISTFNSLVEKCFSKNKINGFVV